MSLKPLAQRMAAHYGRCIETRFIDVENDDGLSDAMGVEETPTVIGVDVAKQPLIRMVGHDGKPARLVEVYDKVMTSVTSCTVDPFRDV